MFNFISKITLIKSILSKNSVDYNEDMEYYDKYLKIENSSKRQNNIFLFDGETWKDVFEVLCLSVEGDLI